MVGICALPLLSKEHRPDHQTRLAIDEYLLNVTGVSEFAVQSHPVPLQLMPAALALPEMLP